MVPKRKLDINGQLLTLFIVGFSIIVYCSPGLSELFVYKRQAILSGEVWRLLTAPFVHFSASHIFWDILIFSIAGIAINASGFPGFWIVCCLTAFIPGLLYIPACPDLQYYGGLSGVATGSAAYYCLCQIFMNGGKIHIWVLILAVMGVKILIEIALHEPLFVNSDSADFIVLPSAHIVGYLGAMTTMIFIHKYRRTQTVYQVAPWCIPKEK